jgi:hypothetical protein
MYRVQTRLRHFVSSATHLLKMLLLETAFGYQVRQIAKHGHSQRTGRSQLFGILLNQTSQRATSPQ